jgi:translation initiation factor 4A
MTSAPSSSLISIDCIICSESFDESTHCPRLLSCGHSLCSLCVGKLIKKRQISCPIDRKVTNAISCDVLPKNYSLLDVLSALSTPSSQRRTCQLCDDEHIATHFCDSCQEYMCQLMAAAHQRMGITRNHTLTAVLEVTAHALGTQQGGRHGEEPSKMESSGSGSGCDSKQWEDHMITSFDELKLKAALLHSVYEMGWEKPSAVQQRAILPLLSGHDVLAQAHPMSGKTSAFAIGILQRIDFDLLACQALVLAPTIELALQIQRVICSLGGGIFKLVCHACVGGTKVRDDVARLKEGVHIVVGTPGRVADMLARKVWDVSHVKLFVLDEADELLSCGFKDEIEDIFTRMTSDSLQVVMTATTFPPEALESSEKLMHNPLRLLVKKELLVEGTRQYYIDVGNEKRKLDSLCNVFDTLKISRTVIFCNVSKKVKLLAEQMRSRNFVVSAFYRELPQQERSACLEDFKSGSSRVLITTDLRGIDLEQTSLVINYDLPRHPEIYAHRISRSGAFGRKGVAISFATKEDAATLSQLRQYYNTKIDKMPANMADLI